MTENLAKMPAKGILRKSSLTFTEHDESTLQITLDCEKPTKVIVEPAIIPKEYPGEAEEEKARREEFELKRRLYRHQEGMGVQLAKRLMSQEENIEEEQNVTQETEEEAEDDTATSDISDAAILDDNEEDLSLEDVTINSKVKSA